ncbi:MAG: NapC/NirT family cytochrome c [Myxococcota bacterium]|nr:NapC/NirT family cytochrome c [Myxococcota bacterium]
MLDWLAWIVVGLALTGLVLVFARYEQLRAATGGPLLLLLCAILLPASAAVVGVASGIERSQRTEFCTSQCHEMEPFARSLTVDDSEYLAATHVQRGLVPRDRACYTCHTDYAMFGGFKAKLNGFRHVLVHYLGTIPEHPKLYAPYANANCLHCHDGTRAFLKVKAHAKVDDGGFAALRAGSTSCVAAGCHDVVHATETLGDAEIWTPTEARVE